MTVDQFPADLLFPEQNLKDLVTEEVFKIRVNRSETDVYVETGKTHTLSFFKGSFVVVPEEKEAGNELTPEPGKMAEGTKRVRPRDEAKPTNLTPWERFLNGTSPTF